MPVAVGGGFDVVRQFLISQEEMVVKKSSGDHLSTGRVGQKLRTRDALVNAAAEFLAKGEEFSVADVADRARVGRATAYRYFPTHAELYAHAALWKLTLLQNKEFEHVFDRSSVFDVIDALVAASDKSTHVHEEEYRAVLRLSLEGREPRAMPVRSAFRRESVKRALKEVEALVGREALERVSAALCLTIGIEAAVVMRDVCLMPPNRSREIKRWAARAILQAALQHAHQGDERTPASPRKAAKKQRPAKARQS